MNLNIYNSIINGTLHPKTINNRIQFSELVHSINNEPNELSEINRSLENLLVALLPSCVQNEQIANINSYFESVDYTPIRNFHLEPNIILAKPTGETIEQKFYTYIINLEARRIKLQLLANVSIIKDNIQNRSEIKTVLNQLLKHAKQLSQLDLCNTLSLLQNHIIKLYFELILIFSQILKDSDYYTFADFHTVCFNRLPESNFVNEYEVAKNVQLAQKAIYENDTIENSQLILKTIYQLAEGSNNINVNPTIIALENYIFLKHLDRGEYEFEQLFNKQFIANCIKEEKEQFKQKYEREELGLERANIIDEILTELSTLVPDINKSPQDSLIKQLLLFLKQQHEVYIKEPATVFKTTIQKQASETKGKPLPTTKPMKQKEKIAIAQKHLSFLNGINPKDQRRFMSEEQYSRLMSYVVHLVTKDEIPSNINKIPKTNISKSWIKYTFYLIHKEYYTNINDTWIEFIQAVFEEYSKNETQLSTIKTKFSVAPSGYHQFIKQVIAE